MGPMPAWAQRRKEAREAEQARRWQARMLALIGDLLFVDGLWSNTSLCAYCVDCRSHAPAPVIEMALEPATRCTHCGHSIGAIEARKVG